MHVGFEGRRGGARATRMPCMHAMHAVPWDQGAAAARPSDALAPLARPPARPRACMHAGQRLRARPSTADATGPAAAAPPFLPTMPRGARVHAHTLHCAASDGDANARVLQYCSCGARHGARLPAQKPFVPTACCWAPCLVWASNIKTSPVSSRTIGTDRLADHYTTSSFVLRPPVEARLLPGGMPPPPLLPPLPPPPP